MSDRPPQSYTSRMTSWNSPASAPLSSNLNAAPSWELTLPSEVPSDQERPFLNHPGQKDAFQPVGQGFGSQFGSLQHPPPRSGITGDNSVPGLLQAEEETQNFLAGLDNPCQLQLAPERQGPCPPTFPHYGMQANCHPSLRRHQPYWPPIEDVHNNIPSWGMPTADESGGPQFSGGTNDPLEPIARQFLDQHYPGGVHPAEVAGALVRFGRKLLLQGVTPDIIPEEASALSNHGDPTRVPLRSALDRRCQTRVHRDIRIRPRKQQPGRQSSRPVEPGPKIRYACREGCDKSFRSTGNRSRHEKIHELGGTWVCKECGYVLSRKDKLRDHMTGQHGDVLGEAEVEVYIKNLKQRPCSLTAPDENLRPSQSATPRRRSRRISASSKRGQQRSNRKLQARREADDGDESASEASNADSTGSHDPLSEFRDEPDAGDGCGGTGQLGNNSLQTYRAGPETGSSEHHGGGCGSYTGFTGSYPASWLQTTFDISDPSSGLSKRRRVRVLVFEDSTPPAIFAPQKASASSALTVSGLPNSPLVRLQQSTAGRPVIKGLLPPPQHAAPVAKRVTSTGAAGRRSHLPIPRAGTTHFYTTSPASPETIIPSPSLASYFPPRAPSSDQSTPNLDLTTAEPTWDSRYRDKQRRGADDASQLRFSTSSAKHSEPPTDCSSFLRKLPCERPMDRWLNAPPDEEPFVASLFSKVDRPKRWLGVEWDRDVVELEGLATVTRRSSGRIRR